ncbi:MAG: 50S ribosomal protein L13 [Candidatus Woesearchaeota archaeon]
MIIDATNLIAGRIASIAAKKALLGETIEIVNCENAIITGNRQAILAKNKRFKDMGLWSQGPFFYKMPHQYLKRIIRGMLPYKKYHGERAYKKIKCYLGVPDHLQGKKLETIKTANISKLSNLKYMTLKEVCKQMGAKL